MAATQIPRRNLVLAAQFTLTAILTINGKDYEMSIARFTSEFFDTLSRLPTARIEIPLGVNTATNKPSPIHAVLQTITDKDTIKVYFSGKGKRTPGSSWTAGDHLVWYGYITGTSFSLGSSSFTYTIDSTHWAKTLENGTVLSSYLTKTNVNALNAPAVIQFATNNAQTVDNSASGLAQLINSASVGNTPDLWLEQLLPGLSCLVIPTSVVANAQANSSGLLKQTLEKLKDANCGKTPAATKYAASGKLPEGNLEAINTITGETITAASSGVVSTLISGKYKFKPAKFGTSKTKKEKFYFNNSAEGTVVPCTLDLGSVLSIQEGINSQIARDLCDSVSQFSALDKLETVANSFMLKFIPNVRTVVAAPVIPLFGKSRVWKTLPANEYVQVDSPTVFSSQLSGVAFMAPSTPYTTLDAADQPNTNDIIGNVAGAFIGSERGRLQILNAPQWLQLQAVRDPTTQAPGLSAGNPAYKKTSTLWDKNAPNTLQTLACRLAQSYWANAQFATRQMALRTPLRFDIGPGSYLKIDGLSLGATRGNTQPAKPVYGYVAGVQTVLDAKNSTAATMLQLTHIRSDQDEIDGLIPLAHPLYTNSAQWKGQNLVRM